LELPKHVSIGAKRCSKQSKMRKGAPHLLDRENVRRHGLGGGLSAKVPEQDSDILDGGNHVILDLLPPESPPAGAFEAMIVGRIGKALLHDHLAAAAIAPGFRTVGLLARTVQQFLMLVPPDGSSVNLGPCALRQ
jgi:hypothetical protein